MGHAVLLDHSLHVAAAEQRYKRVMRHQGIQKIGIGVGLLLGPASIVGDIGWTVGHYFGVPCNRDSPGHKSVCTRDRVDGVHISLTVAHHRGIVRENGDHHQIPLC